MNKIAVVLVALFTAGSAHAAGRLVASEIKGAGIKKSGKIVITNDDRSITAFALQNDLKTALVTLRSIRRALTIRPFGGSVYQSRAAVNSQVPVYLAPLFAEAASTHGIDPRLLAAVARRESRFTPTAVSPVGAQGVMQLMPATARQLGVTDSFDARQNILGGAKYLRMLLDTFEGDLDLTLAAYNAGPGAVRKYKGIPPYKETRAYVAAIRTEYESAIR